MLAGAVAPSEASWGALMVLHTACLRYGAPQYLISDKGGAYISDEFEAVCQRLGIDHKKIAQFISICRWLQLVYKDQLALLENAPFSTL